jgi:hypothetical protein
MLCVVCVTTMIVVGIDIRMHNIYHRSSLPQQMENWKKLHGFFLMFYKISIYNLLSRTSLHMKSNCCSFLIC